MILTPSASSGFISGMGLWALIWTIIFKADTIAQPLKLDGWVSSAGICRWVRANKALTIVITEVINIGTHGVHNSSVATFVLGGTVMNVFMVYGVLPILGKLFGFGEKKVLA